MVQRHDHLAHCVRDETACILARASKVSEPGGSETARPGEVANTLHLYSLPNFVDELHTFRSYRAAYRLLRRQDQAGAARKLKRGTMFKFSMVTSPVL